MQSRGHTSSFQSSHDFGRESDVICSLEIEKDDEFDGFGFDSVVTDGSLSEGGISMTKASLRGMKLAVVFRQIHKSRKDETLKEPPKH